MAERTAAELMPMRPVKVVWEDDIEADCTWCGKLTANTWVIEADPIPERFCSTQCVADDTNMCWSPQEDIDVCTDH